MNNSINILPYSEEHFEQYYNLFCSIVAERKYFTIVQPFPIDSSREFKNTQTITKGHPMLIAFDGDKLIGWCDVFDGDGYTPLLGLGLAVEYREQGIGRLLLTSIIEISRSCGYPILYLNVLADNARAINLYNSLGFKRIEDSMTTINIDGVDHQSYSMQLEL